MTKVRGVQFGVAVYGLLSVVLMAKQFGISIEEMPKETHGIGLVLVPYVIYILLCSILSFRPSLIGGFAIALPSILWCLELFLDPDPLAAFAYLFGVLPFQVLVLLLMLVFGTFMKARLQWKVRSGDSRAVKGPTCS